MERHGDSYFRSTRSNNYYLTEEVMMERSCSWCEEETGVKIPYATHGICQRHHDDLLLDLKIKSTMRAARVIKEHVQNEFRRMGLSPEGELI